MSATKTSAKKWSNRELLNALPNPTLGRYVVHITNPEVTFIGAPNQPDFAEVSIAFTPNHKIIELKSLKFYFYDFRQRLLSYERLINVIFDDLMAVYEPIHLRVSMSCNPRGGISAELVIDSNDR